jgi:hypothetical protein
MGKLRIGSGSASTWKFGFGSGSASKRCQYTTLERIRVADPQSFYPDLDPNPDPAF